MALSEWGRKMYAWKITRDLFDPCGENSSTGVTGPANAPSHLLERLDSEGTGGYPRVKFRLRDDDGEVYAEGVLVADTDNDISYMEPLDDYGVGNWGCTEIQVREYGRWVSV